MLILSIFYVIFSQNKRMLALVGFIKSSCNVLFFLYPDTFVFVLFLKKFKCQKITKKLQKAAFASLLKHGLVFILVLLSHLRYVFLMFNVGFA